MINQSIYSYEIYQKLFSAYADWSSIPFIALPLGICIWSFNKSQSYYQDNETFHKTIQDIIDRKTFGKVIIPLFNYINQSLTKDIISKSKLSLKDDKQGIIEDSDSVKKELIKDYDFSYLESAIELQDSIEKIIKSKRDQVSLKLCVKKSRLFLILTTIMSFLTLLMGLILVGTQAILSFSNSLVVTMLFVWSVCFILTLVFISCFYFFKINIEKMRYE